MARILFSPDELVSTSLGSMHLFINNLNLWKFLLSHQFAVFFYLTIGDTHAQLDKKNCPLVWCGRLTTNTEDSIGKQMPHPCLSKLFTIFKLGKGLHSHTATTKLSTQQKVSLPNQIHAFVDCTYYHELMNTPQHIGAYFWRQLVSCSTTRPLLSVKVSRIDTGDNG